MPKFDFNITLFSLIRFFFLLHGIFVRNRQTWTVAVPVGIFILIWIYENTIFDYSEKKNYLRVFAFYFWAAYVFLRHPATSSWIDVSVCRIYYYLPCLLFFCALALTLPDGCSLSDQRFITHHQKCRRNEYMYVMLNGRRMLWLGPSHKIVQMRISWSQHFFSSFASFQKKFHVPFDYIYVYFVFFFSLCVDVVAWLLLRFHFCTYS